jgi:hypothetical protein
VAGGFRNVRKHLVTVWLFSVTAWSHLGKFVVVSMMLLCCWCLVEGILFLSLVDDRVVPLFCFRLDPDAVLMISVFF